MTVCDGTTDFGKPIFFGEDCELLATSFVDNVYTVVEDACYKIERTWTVLNWCTYNPNLPCIDVPNPNPTIINSQANPDCPTVSACGNNIPELGANGGADQPDHPATTNYCTFYDVNANCYRYKQIIKVIDGVAPVIQCPASVIFCDLTPNDPLLWNASYYYDQVSQGHDLYEGPVDLCITVQPTCASLSGRHQHPLPVVPGSGRRRYHGDGDQQQHLYPAACPAGNAWYVAVWQRHKSELLGWYQLRFRFPSGEPEPEIPFCAANDGQWREQDGLCSLEHHIFAEQLRDS